MKKALLLLALLLTSTSCTSSVLAEDSSPSATPKSGRVGIGVERTKEKAQEARGKAQERISNIKEKIASRTAQLKERLRNFRDQKKAEIVERVNNRLANINEVRTGNMLRHLNKMSEILTKLESRVNGVTDKDTAAAKSAISDAKAKVASAEAVVKMQSEKDYPIEATAEAVIKEDVRGSRNNLHTDLKSVHGLVVDARKALVKAIETVAKTLGGVKNGQQ